MLTARNSPLKHKDVMSALLEAVQLLTQVEVNRAHQRGGSFVSQGNSKAGQIVKQAAWSQESKQVMALAIGPTELPSLHQYSTQEQEHAEKWSYEKRITGWY